MGGDILSSGECDKMHYSTVNKAVFVYIAHNLFVSFIISTLTAQ